LVETATAIVAAHRTGTLTPEETVARSYARLAARGDDAIFITLRPQTEALAEARALSKDAAMLPLYGVPVAVKDNIDVAGMPTTAACPAFTYTAHRDATSVARLRAAGAIIIGKTNLDQFATGLVGVRSPYGIPRNTFNDKLIPGGSSSGSGVAVAAGIVPIALGTDTAGSGRVPAALNNIVGLKPSLGLVPTSGVVPACRTLDCVSIFALTVDDAVTTLRAIAGEDMSDPFSRPRTFGALTSFPPNVRVGFPKAGQRIFFGDHAYASAYDDALKRIESLGAKLVEVDIEALYETARLLYEGPWVAERYLTVRNLVASAPEAMHPITLEIILQGSRPSAADAFAAFYRLAELRRACEGLFRTIDVLMLPTIPTTFTVQQVLDSPLELNSRLGLYTNFVNLLDLCGLAIPSAITANNIPFGVTLLAPAGNDAMLASIGRVLHAAAKLPLGALRVSEPELAVAAQ
jgi:allophanate hydrolase